MSYRESDRSGRESSESVTDAWVRASGHVLNSVVEANRAALAAFGFDSDGSDDGAASESARRRESDLRPEPDWSVERSAESADRLGLGDTVTFTKSIDDENVLAFARASGDTNPLHLSNGFAEQTRFGGRIAHGTLVSGVVSAALARLPGLVIYLSQETQYLNPVRPGDAVTATVEVTEVLGEQRYRLSTEATVGDRSVLEGEAVVLVDESPGEAPSSE
jgi:acyl dehydratase